MGGAGGEPTVTSAIQVRPFQALLPVPCVLVPTRSDETTDYYEIASREALVALLSDDLSKLPHLLTLSRQAIRAIHQNLVFSLGVLAIAVGLTIPGILTPITGALLHELSSIPVIANSARLIAVRERKPTELALAKTFSL